MNQTLRRLYKPSSKQSQAAGFTLIEGLIVVAIIGLMAAIAAPSFFGFLQQRKINTARDMLYQALRVTQTDAMQQRHDRRFSIRERNGQVEWANHPESVLANRVTVWQPLIDNVVLANIDNTLAASGGIHYVKFDMYGNIKGQLGTVTVAISGPSTTHRCVVASTMLGAIRKGKGHTRANGNDRFCY